MKTRFDGHTPGPWNKNGLRELLRFGRKHDGSWNEVGLDTENMPDDTDHHLIAASSDLLARLKAMYEWLKLIEIVRVANEGNEKVCPYEDELRATEQLLGINQTEVKEREVG